MTTFSSADRSHFRHALQEHGTALRGKIRDVLLRGDEERYAQIAGEVHDAEDEALADLLVDVNLAEITHQVQELRDIQAALRRIDLGTYGVCVRCREPIDRGRLEAYPTAKRCVSCQQLKERSPMAASAPSL